MRESPRSWLSDAARGLIRPRAGWILLAALSILVLYYVTRALSVDSAAPVRLVVYAFSTQEEVLSQGIFPAFERDWEAATGRDLVIDSVFGASGTLAGQINLGAPADVAVFSNAEQVNWLRVGRKVERTAQPVIVGCTPMIIALRPGLPFSIDDYSDLAQEGLDLLHTNPRSSGAGQWAVLAEYGSALRSPAGDLGAGDDPARAKAQLAAIWQNVRVLADSARAAMALFELGAGDALVTYEQDALLARERGVALDIVYPPRTIVAQHAAVIVDDNVTRAERGVAAAFIDYLLSEPGRQVFYRYYLRSPDCRSDPLSELAEPFRIEDLGGWSQAYAQIVETLWQGEIEPRLELQGPGAVSEEPSFRLLDTGD